MQNNTLQRPCLLFAQPNKETTIKLSRNSSISKGMKKINKLLMKSKLLLLRKTFQHQAYLTKNHSVMQVNKPIKLKMQIRKKHRSRLLTFDYNLLSEA
jgi:hypothetical protein